MEKSKAILISAIVLFAIGIILFAVSLFVKMDSNMIFAYIGGAFVILSIVAVYAGTIIKVNENKKKV